MSIPFVSLCTPTFNRRPFFPILFEMFKLQTYPKNRMEWIIIDDGTDKIGDLIKSSGIKQIKYIELPKKLSLGEKRNLMHTYCKGSIILYVDDDDYFPQDRVMHSVDALMGAKNGELIAGSSEMYLYFKEHGLYQFGPYGPNHATAGTFAFRRELLNKTRYDDNSCLGEEEFFLKRQSFPMIQLNPTKTILVFPHNHNTFDKHTFLEDLTPDHPCIKKCTDKTIDDFITGTNSHIIKHFFLNDMHKLLIDYKAGEPSMKPDVLIQTQQIKIQRNLTRLKMEEQNQQNNRIMLVQPDGTTIPLTNEQICQRLIRMEQLLGQQNPIMIKQPDGTPIAITNEQACNIIMEQQRVIFAQKELIDQLQNNVGGNIR